MCIYYIHMHKHVYPLCSDNWSEETSPVSTPRFVEPVGPTTILSPTVLGVFHFFTTTLVASIVKQTNLYARQVLGDAAERKWTDVTADDIWALPS